MRICIVYQGEFPPAERIEKISKTLASAGHQVFLLCNNYGKFALSEETVGDVHTLRVKPSLKNRKINKILKFPVFLNPLWIWQIFQTVRRYRIEALQVVDIPLAAAVWAVGRWLRVPVVMDMWENYPEFLKGLAKLHWSFKILKNPSVARAVELWVTPRMDHIFVVVDEQRDKLIGEGVRPERISVVTNAVDMELLTRAPLRFDTPLDADPEAYKLLYVGVLGVERGLEDIIRALSKLQNRIPAIRFYMAGSGIHEEYLRQLAASEGVSHLVRFLGWVRFDDIHSYVTKSDLCIVPHIYNGFINTTIPNKLFQYMALAKPILVSHAKPLARIVTECRCGFVFESGNPSDAAAKIEEAYASRNDREIGQRGRQCAEAKYTWEKASLDLLRVYADLQAKGQ
jgi:glycosyltransferase involved in cell wall biosynthesis